MCLARRSPAPRRIPALLPPARRLPISDLVSTSRPLSLSHENWFPISVQGFRRRLPPRGSSGVNQEIISAESGARSQGSTKILKRNYQGHAISSTWIETEGEVEFPCFLRDGVHNNATDSDGIGGVYDAPAGIAKQRPPYSSTLIIPIDSQPGQHHHWNRIWHVSAESPGYICLGDGSRRESVIGGDALLFAYYIGPRSFACLVRSRTAPKPVV